MRSLIVAAAAALAFASAAGAAPTGPFNLIHGHCHALDGKRVAARYCKAAACHPGVSQVCGGACIPANLNCEAYIAEQAPHQIVKKTTPLN